MTAPASLVANPASLPEHRRIVPLRLLLCLRGVEAVAVALPAAALEELFQGLLRIMILNVRVIAVYCLPVLVLSDSASTAILEYTYSAYLKKGSYYIYF